MRTLSCYSFSVFHLLKTNTIMSGKDKKREEIVKDGCQEKKKKCREGNNGEMKYPFSFLASLLEMSR